MTKNITSHRILIGPFKELLTMEGLPLKGALSDQDLKIIPNAGIIVGDERILEIGNYNTLKASAGEDTELEEIKGDMVVLPGFVDAHTHICFGGSRARDYALRNSGKTYLEIAKAGGGIWDTVTQTRRAGKTDLVSGILERSHRHLRQGVTTIEVKSGYGLSVEEELKMLYAIREAGDTSAADLVPTCLAAHMVPREYKDRPIAYLDLIREQLFPVIQGEGLANRVDAFVEESAFSPAQMEGYFGAARDMGFSITVHADQFTTGGSQAAINYGAVSADHLEASSIKEVRALAGSDVIATALPGASLGLGCAFTPARQLLDEGAALAIASDWNPGSAPMGDLLAQAAILGAFQKLSNAEVLAGITSRAAAALELNDRGVLIKGKKADFVAFPTYNYQEILYKQGSLKPCQVWKAGQAQL